MSSTKLKPVVVIGGGGHASVLVDILRAQNRKILAIISHDAIKNRKVFAGIKHLDNDHDVLAFAPGDVLLINGIGMMPRTKNKRILNDHFLSLGYRFGSVIASSALISPFATLGEGIQVLPHAVIQAGATIGEHSVINTGAIVEHDSTIGAYNHIGPRATLCGQVTTQEDVYVGAGATVIQNVQLDRLSIVGAGSIVTCSIKSKQIVYPNRNIIKQEG